MPLPTQAIIKFQDQATPGPVNVVRFNGTGQYCITGGQDRTLKLWKPQSGQHIKTFTGHSREVLTLDISKDNRNFVSGSADKSVFLWDVAAAKIVSRYRGHFQRVNCVAFNEDSNVVASGSFDSTVHLWDCRSRSQVPIQILSHAKDSVSSLIVTKHEIIAGSVDGSVRTYDLRNASMITDKISHAVTCVTLSGDGNCLLASSLDSTLRLIDKETGDLLSKYTGHINHSFMLDSIFDVTDAYVISGSEDGRVCFWDLVEEELVAAVKKHPKAVQSLSYHPERCHMLSASSDGSVVFWGPGKE